MFYGNRSAAYASMEDHELVIADCSSALELNPSYAKVLMRRCQAFEATEKYDEALAGTSNPHLSINYPIHVSSIFSVLRHQEAYRTRPNLSKSEHHFVRLRFPMSIMCVLQLYIKVLIIRIILQLMRRSRLEKLHAEKLEKMKDEALGI